MVRCDVKGDRQIERMRRRKRRRRRRSRQARDSRKRDRFSRFSPVGEKKLERASSSGSLKRTDRAAAFLFRPRSREGSREFRYNARLASASARERAEGAADRKGLLHEAGKGREKVKLHGKADSAKSTLH